MFDEIFHLFTNDLKNFFQLDRDRQLKVLAIAHESITTLPKSEVLQVESLIYEILDNPFEDCKVRVAAAGVLEIRLGNTRF